jgi:hypothetical protein
MEQYEDIKEFMSGYDKKYNMVNNNCTTFAVKALETGGIISPNTAHEWFLPEETKHIVKENLPKLLPFKDKIADKLMQGLSGYTPADAGEDIRESSGYYLINDDTGVHVIYNY